MIHTNEPARAPTHVKFHNVSGVRSRHVQLSCWLAVIISLKEGRFAYFHTAFRAGHVVSLSLHGGPRKRFERSSYWSNPTTIISSMWHMSSCFYTCYLSYEFNYFRLFYWEKSRLGVFGPSPSFEQVLLKPNFNSLLFTLRHGFSFYKMSIRQGNQYNYFFNYYFFFVDLYIVLNILEKYYIYLAIQIKKGKKGSTDHILLGLISNLYKRIIITRWGTNHRDDWYTIIEIRFFFSLNV